MSEGQSMQVDLMGELQKRLDAALARVEELEQELRVTDVRLFQAERTGKQAAAQLAEIIEQKDKLIAEANERADVRGKLAEAFGEVLCQIAGTTDRVQACALASDRFAKFKQLIDKLPKTTDGVPFVCGPVYVRREHAIIQNDAVAAFYQFRPPQIEYRWGEPIGQCYSTYKAAEAAKAAEPTP